MFEILKDSTLYEYVTGSPPADLASMTGMYEFWENRRSPDKSELWLNWAMQLKGTRQLIGHLQAGVKPQHADIAWVLGLPWQHQGYATEGGQAVVDLLVRIGVREIRASIHPAHEASIAVAKRLGLQRTDDIVDKEVIWKRIWNTIAE
jgi:RimJ/RimL family protein N-acetyltransferase